MARDPVKHAKQGVIAPTSLSVERMVHGGVALARTQAGEVALVTGAVPGETVVAGLRREKGVLRGECSEVLTASPDRVPAHAHPGLDYSFMSYPRQLREKAAVVTDALARARAHAAGSGRVDRPDVFETTVPTLTPAPEPWGYRVTVQPAAVPAGLGYRRPGSADVVVLGGDPTAVPAVNDAWTTLVGLGAHRGPGVREVVIRANDAGEVLVALIAESAERELVPLAHELVRAGLKGVVHAPHDRRGRFRAGSRRLAGARTLEQRYGRVVLTVDVTSFAQPNPRAAGALYQELAEWAGAGDTAVELFAGGGAIAFHLAPSFSRVIAVEIDRGAISRGQRDATRLGVDNVEFVRQDARGTELPREVELMVVDPPRAGLSAATRAGIVASPVTRLIYVSCDVATWARDVADLERHGFELARLKPYDFYPQTHHVELLSELTRN